MKNLINEKSSYTFAINNHYSEIMKAYEDRQVSDDSLEQLVLNSISDASDTPAKRKFIATLQSFKFKKNRRNEIIFYVGNAWLKGQNNGVIA